MSMGGIANKTVEWYYVERSGFVLEVSFSRDSTVFTAFIVFRSM